MILHIILYFLYHKQDNNIHLSFVSTCEDIIMNSLVYFNSVWKNKG